MSVQHMVLLEISTEGGLREGEREGGTEGGRKVRMKGGRKEGRKQEGRKPCLLKIYFISPRAAHAELGAQ